MLTKQESAVLAQVQQAVQAGRFPPEALREVRQKFGERALYRYAAQLSPEHVALARQIYQQQGWPGLQAALAQAGLMAEAVEIAGATLAHVGFEGLASAVQGGIQQEVERETTEAAIARATPKDGDLSAAARTLSKSELAAGIRDPEAQKSAAEWLRARGLTPEPGLSPLEQMIKTTSSLVLEDQDGSLAFQKQRHIGEAKIDQETHIQEAARLYREDPATLKKWAETLDRGVTQHNLASRQAQRDARTTRIPLDPDAAIRLKKEAAQRSALEAKYQQLDAADSAKRARLSPSPTRAAPTPPAAPRSAQGRYESRRATLSEAADRIERGEPAGTSPEAVSDEGSRHAALSDAYDAIEAESSDAGEETIP